MIGCGSFLFILVIDVRRAMVNLIEGESKSSAGDIIHGVLSFLLPCYTPFGLPYQLMWIYYDCDLTNKKPGCTPGEDLEFR